MAKFLGKSLRRSVSDKDPTMKSVGSKSFEASGSDYFYLTGIVKDFIGDPNVYLNAKKGNIPKVINPGDYQIMTKNCLIAYIIDNAESLKGQPPVICYPFFPHLSLPIKPGEHVWLLKEEFRGRNVFYWLSRKAGVRQTDDPNYTYAERFILIDEKLNPAEKGKEQRNLLQNDVSSLPDSAYSSFDNSSFDNLPDDLNNNILVSDSFAFKQGFTLEPVPPIRRKCGDTLLLGSNNTLVHLTTEKFKTSTLNKKDFTGLQTEPNLPGRYPFSPAIDLCVARKKEELTALKETTTPTGKSGAVEILKGERGSLHSELESYEIDKLGNLLDKNRPYFPSLSTDSNATNCGARLYLSNNCAVDETFGSSFDDLDTLGGSSLVTYADHNRIIADNSLRLTNRIGQSFLNMDTEGNISIKASNIIELSSPIEGGIKAISVGGEGGAVLSVQPIQDFIETWKDLTLDQKTNFPPLMTVPTIDSDIPTSRRSPGCNFGNWCCNTGTWNNYRSTSHKILLCWVNMNLLKLTWQQI